MCVQVDSTTLESGGSMTGRTIEEFRTQDIVGYPVDLAVYQARDTTGELSKEQVITLVAHRAAEQIAAQIHLVERYSNKSYPAAQTRTSAAPSPYPFANLGLAASQMPEEKSKSSKIRARWSAAIAVVFQGMFVALLAEAVVFGSAYLVAHFVFGWCF